MLAALSARTQDKKPTPNVRLSPGDCSWDAPASTTGRGRRSMKTRTAKDAAAYKTYNRGKAIDLTEWFGFDQIIVTIAVD